MRILSFNNVPLVANPHPYLDENGNHLDSVAVILNEEKEIDCIKAGINVKYNSLWGPYIVMYCVSPTLKEKVLYPGEVIKKFPENSDIPNDRIFVGSVKFSRMKYSIKGNDERYVRCCLVDISKN